MSVFAGTAVDEEVHAFGPRMRKRFSRLKGLCFDPSAGGSVISVDRHSVRRIKDGTATTYPDHRCADRLLTVEIVPWCAQVLSR